MKIKFTEKSIRNLEPQLKPYEALDTSIIGFLLRVQPTGAKTFYLSYRNIEGKRKRFKIGKYGELTLSKANLLAKGLVGEIANGNDPQKDKLESRERLKKEELNSLGKFYFNSYKPWVVKNRKSGLETAKRIERCFSFLFDVPLSKVSKSLIETWQMEQLDKGLKASTINRNLNSLRSVLSKAVVHEVIDKSPLSGFKDITESDDARVRYLSSDEQVRLYKAIKQRNDEMIEARRAANDWRLDRGYLEYPKLSMFHFVDHIEPMVLLAMHTGVRRGELFSLSWSDVDFNHKKITIRAEKAKSNKLRHISLNQTAFTVLKRWLEQTDRHGFVFKKDKGQRFTTIRKAWNNLLKRANIADFRFHDLRHNFASQLVMKGVPLNTVRELLGHSDMTTTLRYAHLGEQHKLDAVALLEI